MPKYILYFVRMFFLALMIIIQGVSKMRVLILTSSRAC
jgi:hypothetical protein